MVVHLEGRSGNWAVWWALWRSFLLLFSSVETTDEVMVGLDWADAQHSKGDVIVLG